MSPTFSKMEGVLRELVCGGAGCSVIASLGDACWRGVAKNARQCVDKH